MHACEVERVYCLVVFGAGPGQRSSKHWMSSSELSESQAVITPRSPTHSRQLTPVTLEWCVCVCTSLSHRKKKGGLKRREKTEDKKYMCMQQVCILCYRKECVHRQACGHSVSTASEWKLRMCALWRKEEGVFFSSPLSSSLSPCQSYIPPLYFPFLHAAPDVKAVKILNYRNGLVSALWLHQKQPSLCSLLTWRTLSHTLIIIAEDVEKCTPQVKESNQCLVLTGCKCAALQLFDCVKVMSTHTLNESQVAISTAGCLGALMCNPCTGHKLLASENLKYEWPYLSGPELVWVQKLLTVDHRILTTNLFHHNKTSAPF